MKKFANLFFLTLFVFCLCFVVACSESNENTDANAASEDSAPPANNNNDNDGAEVEAEVEPITITFMIDYPEDRLNRKFIEPIQNEFPHISIEQINVQSVNREQVEEMVTRGEFPDLAFFHNSAGIELFEEFELAYDLSELIAQNNYDLNRF